MRLERVFIAVAIACTLDPNINTSEYPFAVKRPRNNSRDSSYCLSESASRTSICLLPSTLMNAHSFEPPYLTYFSSPPKPLYSILENFLPPWPADIPHMQLCSIFSLHVSLPSSCRNWNLASILFVSALFCESAEYTRVPRHAVFGSHLCPVVLWPHIFSFKNRSQADYQFYLLTSVWLLLVRQEAVLTGFLLCARGFSASVHVIIVFVVLSDPLREMIDILILKIRNGVQRS